MGFDLRKVLSDDKHYSVFICVACQELVTLPNPLVFEGGVACQECCSLDLTCDALPGQVGSQLQEAQPLAYRLLEQVQVMNLSDNWSGDYGLLTSHLNGENGQRWNTSSSSINFTPSPKSRDAAPNLVQRTKSDENQLQLHKDEVIVSPSKNMEDLLSPQRQRKLLEKAEKLKKQANAKFNKGDLVHSRDLYTEGITLVAGLEHNHAELAAHMYSNRAVTYFREKRFDQCVEDCNQAISLLPKYEKSWIRKWRALMAQGNAELAHSSLTKGLEAIPDSKRIAAELDSSRREMQLLSQAQEFLRLGDYSQTRELLEKHETDNIQLLHCLAQAHVGLGRTEAAIEVITKALRVNPTHVDGLALRGHALYLSGDVAKGLHILQETFNRDKSNTKLEARLQSSQATHTALTKARAAVKRGKYESATDYFTKAMQTSGPIPTRCPLFEILRLERAEAYLLSRQFVQALKDCQEVLLIHDQNATAWTTRAEILVALGKTKEAHNELSQIKRTWGVNNENIHESFRRVDYQVRIMDADDQLSAFVNELQQGNTAVLNVTMNIPTPEKKSSSPRRNGRNKRTPSRTGSNAKR